MQRRRTRNPTRAFRSDLRHVVFAISGLALAGALAGSALAALNHRESLPPLRGQAVAPMPVETGATIVDVPPRHVLPLPEAQVQALSKPDPVADAPPARSAEAEAEWAPPATARPVAGSEITVLADQVPEGARPAPVPEGEVLVAEIADQGMEVADRSGTAGKEAEDVPPVQARPVQAADPLEVPRPRRVAGPGDPLRLPAGGLAPDRLATMFVPQDLTGMDRTWRKVGDLQETFGRIGYDLAEVRAGQAVVPRIFVAAFPDDIESIELVEQRKRTFLKAILPLVLRANDSVLAERRRLKSVIAHLEKGGSLARSQIYWLSELADRYGGSPDDLDDLLTRVDTVPISLALAQAAEESGWGTSRFAREGNAVFGQWTWDTEAGIVPRDRPRGRNHLVRKFPALQHSVSEYVRNLNSNPAYAKFRAARAARRAADEPFSGRELAAYLTAYSERGPAYVRTLRMIMAHNGLEEFDNVHLDDTGGRWTAGLADQTLLSVF